MQTDCAANGVREYAAAKIAALLRILISRFATRQLLILAVVSSGLFLSAQSKPAQSKPAQSTGKTVRHHQVEEPDPVSAKINQAEDDIGKQDYAAAESLLKQAVAEMPENYSAWYDLGFVYHATGRREGSIAAYRKSIASRPDIFESNLNRGVALAEADLQGLGSANQAATPLLERFAQQLGARTPVNRAELLVAYVRSDLAAALYPVTLTSWDAGNQPTSAIT